MKNYPYISIVICIYNGEKTLQGAIDSLLKQDNYPKDKYEIIFVDDGSSDRSAQICRKILEKRKNEYPRITYALKKNGGLSMARNTGIYIATGQIIAFIDQDAVATKNWVLNIANEFASSNSPKIIGGPVLLLNKDSKFASLLYDSFFSHYMKGNHSVIGTNMAFSKTLLNEKTPFHPSFVSRGDETYIFDKLKPRAVPVQISGAAVYHESPESLKSWLMSRYDNGYFKVLLDSMNVNDVDTKKKLFLKIANKLLFLITPIIIILSLLMRIHVLMYLGIFTYVLITFRRYLATGYLKDLMKQFWTTRKAKSVARLRLVPVILFLVLLGY